MLDSSHFSLLSRTEVKSWEQELQHFELLLRTKKAVYSYLVQRFFAGTLSLSSKGDSSS